MVGRITWEDETRARIERAQEHLNKAEAEVRHWSERVKVLQAALALETSDNDYLTDAPKKALPLDSGRMSVVEACKVVASQHGGLVETRTATKELIKSGFFLDTNHARDSLYSALKRSRSFERVRPGVYKLVSPLQAAEVRQNRTGPTSETLTEIILRLVVEHPQWNHQQLVTGVAQAGYDFQGKKPGLAVNMAVQRLKRFGKKDNAVAA